MNVPLLNAGPSAWLGVVSTPPGRLPAAPVQLWAETEPLPGVVTFGRHAWQLGQYGMVALPTDAHDPRGHKAQPFPYRPAVQMGTANQTSRLLEGMQARIGNMCAEELDQL